MYDCKGIRWIPYVINLYHLFKGKKHSSSLTTLVAVCIYIAYDSSASLMLLTVPALIFRYAFYPFGLCVHVQDVQRNDKCNCLKKQIENSGFPFCTHR